MAQIADVVRVHVPLMAAVASTVLVIASTIVLTGPVQHGRALDSAEAANARLAAAQEQYSTAAARLTSKLAAAVVLHDALAAATADGGAYLGEERTAAIDGSLADLQGLVDDLSPSVAATETVALDEDNVDETAIDATASTAELDALAERLTGDRAAIAKDTAALRAAGEALAARTSAAEASVEAALAAVPDIAAQLLAANSGADAASKTAFDAAVLALAGRTAKDDLAALVGNYVAAAAQLQSSHAAAQRTSSGGGGNTGSGGSNSGGGGGGSTGGGGSGGGTVDNNRYVQTNSYYVPFGSCTWATDYSTHDPGPGGTSVPSFTYPWSYKNMGTYIQFYTC
jgi:uncharacterized membrane protein YgcG